MMGGQAGNILPTTGMDDGVPIMKYILPTTGLYDGVSDRPGYG